LKQKLLAPVPAVQPDRTPVEHDWRYWLGRVGNAMGGAGVIDSLSPAEQQAAGLRALGSFSTGLMQSARYEPGKTIFSNLGEGFAAADRSVAGSEREGARVLAGRQAALTESQKQQIEGIKAALPLLTLQGQQAAVRGMPGSLLGPNVGSVGPAGDYSVPPALLPLYQQAAAKYGVPVELLIAQHKQESNLTPGATGGAGEVGLGQILPATAKSPGFGMTGTNPAALRDPAANIDFSAQYLAARAKAAGADLRTPEGVQKALRAYNGGGDPNYVQNVLRYVPGAQKALGGGGGGGQAGVAPAPGTPTIAPAGRGTLPPPEPAMAGTAQTAGPGAPTGTAIPPSPPGSAADVADIRAGMVAAGADPNTLAAGPGSKPGVPPAVATAQLSPLPPGMDAHSREAYGILHPITPSPEERALFNPQPDPNQMAAIEVRKANAERAYQAAKFEKDPVAATNKARELLDKATADENTLRENARKLGTDTQAKFYEQRRAALDAAWAAEQAGRRADADAARTQTNAIELERIKQAGTVEGQGALVALKTDERRMGKMADAADAAQTMSNSVRQLVPIIKTLPPDGVLSSAVGALPQLTGALKLAGIISPETADNISLFRGVTEHLSTQLRATGTGSMSDKDLDTFKSALPQMMQTPDGRLKAAAFLQNLADRIVAEQAFATDYFTRVDPATGKPAHNLKGLNKAINAPRDQGGLGDVLPQMPKFTGDKGYDNAVAWIQNNVNSGQPYMVWEQDPQGKWTQHLVVKE